MMRLKGPIEGPAGGPSATVTAPTSVDTARAEPPPRGSLRLLIDPLYGPFWFGKVLSTIGMWVHNVAAAIVTYQLTRSTTMVAAVSIAQFVPQLLFAPLSGASA